MVAFMRYMHLRSCKRSYLTTNRLDAEVQFAWGIPLSIILAASCYWYGRLRSWPAYTVLWAWGAGYCVYAGLLACLIRPFVLKPLQSGGDDSLCYQEVVARRLYDWHNCNPVRVLLSNCCEGLGEPLAPYEIGKEYLQLREVREEAGMSMRPVRSAVQVNRRSRLDRLPNMPELETLLQKPLACVATAMRAVRESQSCGDCHQRCGLDASASMVDAEIVTAGVQPVNLFVENRMSL